MLTEGICSHRPRERLATFCHTAGSEPEPMCVCTRAGSRSYSLMIACTWGMSSCQMPKEEAGPPTLVLPVPPLPSPGLKRTPSWSVRSPLHALPYASSCRSEHALYLMPSASRSGRSAESSCELRLILSAVMPAAIARRTSNPLLASMCSPSVSKSCSTAALGRAFMAKRTVRPKACGKSIALSACRLSVASSYTKNGVPNSSRSFRVPSEVRKRSFSGVASIAAAGVREAAAELATEVGAGARKPAWKERPVVIRVSIVCREERRCRG
mmetsp:Transcript_75948/g.183560  ORF Transcript_75948/g.183560 Transcript_75948/m.183560 type:complete len:269 (-) Transcript_75948:7-813(-)